MLEWAGWWGGEGARINCDVCSIVVLLQTTSGLPRESKVHGLGERTRQMLRCVTFQGAPFAAARLQSGQVLRLAFLAALATSQVFLAYAELAFERVSTMRLELRP